MRADIRYVAGLVLAAVAALWWAVGVTVLQPLTEPLGPWSELLLRGNPYWARELRWGTVFAVALALILAAGGDRRHTGAAVLLAGAWVAADVLADRAQPQGAPATVLLAAGGWLAIAGTVLLAQRGRSRPGEVRGWPERRTLTAAACVAAALLVVTAQLGDPGGRAADLAPAAYVTGALLLAVTVGCALAAAPSPDRVRPALALAGVGALGFWLARLAPAGGLLVAALLGAVVLTGVTVLAWDRAAEGSRWKRSALVAFGTLLGVPVLLVLAALVVQWLRLGALFTSLAGNVVVSSDDGDVPYAFAGLLAGLVIALVLAWPNALGQRPPHAVRRQ
ncbi:hypothetical protein K7640_11055 [Micromonospora sp. PLK6-60]|uniref:hypothetical protein n=1 Tax=Micromonospora sp. PLK6-60 TaxID=2873383 RepID=UPI001CA72D6E|nr:hypothetical protein [Micromonospora sp. PLK6-60]MBY8872377.1 hypothetical protein [Micromonospora sp. PLK6-60]